MTQILAEERMESGESEKVYKEPISTLLKRYYFSYQFHSNL